MHVNDRIESKPQTYGSLSASTRVIHQLVVRSCQPHISSIMQYAPPRHLIVGSASFSVSFDCLILWVLGLNGQSVLVYSSHVSHSQTGNGA
ncbi:hypothetical protein PAHAL_3G104300 [Panicum hallii]|uniref:Uncharacterized protein n=1 Tax=Panicum hallii TaxID=206008 RepID=A0A2S3H7Q3_9POAL|nr:hypothetical protein PAHAL_3G104300 [Panicum hallii]